MIKLLTKKEKNQLLGEVSDLSRNVDFVMFLGEIVEQIKEDKNIDFKAPDAKEQIFNYLADYLSDTYNVEIEHLSETISSIYSDKVAASLEKDNILNIIVELFKEVRILNGYKYFDVDFVKDPKWENLLNNVPFDRRGMLSQAYDLLLKEYAFNFIETNNLIMIDKLSRRDFKVYGKEDVYDWFIDYFMNKSKVYEHSFKAFRHVKNGNIDLALQEKVKIPETEYLFERNTSALFLGLIFCTDEKLSKKEILEFTVYLLKKFNIYEKSEKEFQKILLKHITQ